MGRKRTEFSSATIDAGSLPYQIWASETDIFHRKLGLLLEDEQDLYFYQIEKQSETLGEDALMGCNLHLEGKCKMNPFHSAWYRTFASVVGTAPGLLILIFSAQFRQAFKDAGEMVPMMLGSVCFVVFLAYIGVVWTSAHKSDRVSILDYATQTAASFSTTIAALPFLKGVLGA